MIGLKGKAKNLKLNYGICDDFLEVICPFRVCFSKATRLKNLQYDRCKDQVKKQLNFDYIVKRLNELEFLKVVMLNKEQVVSFDYFEKPLVCYKKDGTTTVDNRLMTEIHQVLQIGEAKHTEMLCNYFNSMSPDAITEIDFKIRRLLNSNS